MKKKIIKVSGLCLIAIPAGNELNDKAVEKLATTLKTTPEKIKEELLTAEKDPAKMTTKIGEVVDGLEVLTKAEKDTLLDNHGRQKYDHGKIVGEEMQVKDAKKLKGMETSKAKTLPDFLTELETKIKADSGIAVDAQVSQLNTEKQALQTTVLDRDKEILRLNGEVANVKTSTIINAELERAVKEVQIDIAEDKVSAQREMLNQAFMTKHEVKFEEGKVIVYREGKKLVDNIQNPLKVADVMKEFAPKYVNVKVPGGRGDQSSDNGNTLNEELSKIKTKDDYVSYLDKNGIKQISDKAQTILSEVKKANPNFTLV